MRSTRWTSELPYYTDAQPQGPQRPEQRPSSQQEPRSQGCSPPSQRLEEMWQQSTNSESETPNRDEVSSMNPVTAGDISSAIDPQLLSTGSWAESDQNVLGSPQEMDRDLGEVQTSGGYRAQLDTIPTNLDQEYPSSMAAHHQYPEYQMSSSFVAHQQHPEYQVASGMAAQQQHPEDQVPSDMAAHQQHPDYGQAHSSISETPTTPQNFGPMPRNFHDPYPVTPQTNTPIDRRSIASQDFVAQGSTYPPRTLRKRAARARPRLNTSAGQHHMAQAMLQAPFGLRANAAYLTPSPSSHTDTPMRDFVLSPQWQWHQSALAQQGPMPQSMQPMMAAAPPPSFTGGQPVWVQPHTMPPNMQPMQQSTQPMMAAAPPTSFPGSSPAWVQPQPIPPNTNSMPQNMQPMMAAATPSGFHGDPAMWAQQQSLPPSMHPMPASAPPANFSGGRPGVVARDDMHDWASGTRSRVQAGPSDQHLQPRNPGAARQDRRSRSGRRSGSATPGTRSFPCLHAGCGKSYEKKSQLDHHARYHGPRPHACSLCDKDFIFPKDLKRHMKTHSPEERHLFCNRMGCKYQTKGFAREDHWKRHAKTHEPRSPAGAK